MFKRWNLQTRIIGRDSANVSRGGIYKLVLWPEILKNPIAKVSRGGIYQTETQEETLQKFQEVEFINQDYRQK